MNTVRKEIVKGALKTLLNCIPNFGPALIEAIFETPSRIEQQRRDEYSELNYNFPYSLDPPENA